MAGQRASSLRFGDPRAGAVRGLGGLPATARRLRQSGPARNRGAPAGTVRRGYHRNRTTYDLRRLRLRGLIERIPHTRRYRVTDDGVRTALCYQRTHAGVMKPALAVSFDPATPSTARLRRVLEAFDDEINRLWEGRQLAA